MHTVKRPGRSRSANYNVSAEFTCGFCMHMTGSRAACMPVPAAVMAWRHFLSCTSPAANTPATLVSVVPGLVTT